MSHDNSARQFKEQPAIALDVLASRNKSLILRTIIRGVMIESFIKEGNQRPEDSAYGKSITDPCLGWAATERLLLDIADRA